MNPTHVTPKSTDTRKLWLVRHSRTNVFLGWLRHDIAPLYLEPTGARRYRFAVMPPISWTVSPASLDDRVRADYREVIIDTRRPRGNITLWIDKASELHGVDGFIPWW